MISRSIPSAVITRFKAVPQDVKQGRDWEDRQATFEVDPQVVGVENLEFANCKSNIRSWYVQVT